MSTALKIHQEMLDAWNRRDFDAMRELYHPDYTYMGGDGKEVAGGPDVGVKVAQTYAEAFPDGRIEMRKTFVQGDAAVAEFVVRGHQTGSLLGAPPTGNYMEIPVCNVIELRDGKIYREREYIDMLAMLSQLGISQLPESTMHA
jgi:steroid delta-isomerase-like uncharacterized protein